MVEKNKSIDIQNKELDVHKKEAEVATSAERTRERRVYVPKADIYETQNDFILVADMPGVDDGSADITLEKNELTINGYVEPEQITGYSLANAEYGIDDYQRTFILSDEIDRDKIEASVKNGVLHLRLPKAPVAKARKIAVKAG